MSGSATEILTGVLLAGLAAGLVLAFVRLVRGRSLPDRVVALDVLSAASVGIAGVTAIQSGATVFLDVALVTALISFVGTVAFAFYLEQRSARGRR